MRLVPSSSIGLLCALAMPFTHAADIEVFGFWSEQLGAIDLASGAGSDIRSPIISDPLHAQINIANTGGGSWTLVLRREGSNLPSEVTLAVRRSSSGSGAGSVSGGEDYLTVTDSDQALFSGSGDRDGIGLQLRLQGVSVRHGAGTFGSLLRYAMY